MDLLSLPLRVRWWSCYLVWILKNKTKTKNRFAMLTLESKVTDLQCLPLKIQWWIYCVYLWRMKWLIHNAYLWKSIGGLITFTFRKWSDWSAVHTFQSQMTDLLCLHFGEWSGWFFLMCTFESEVLNMAVVTQNAELLIVDTSDCWLEHDLNHRYLASIKLKSWRSKFKRWQHHRSILNDSLQDWEIRSHMTHGIHSKSTDLCVISKDFVFKQK